MVPSYSLRPCASSQSQPRTTDKLHITEGDSHSRQSVTNQTEHAKDLCEAPRALLTVRLIGEGIPEIRIMNAV